MYEYHTPLHYLCIPSVKEVAETRYFHNYVHIHDKLVHSQVSSTFEPLDIREESTEPQSMRAVH